MRMVRIACRKCLPPTLKREMVFAESEDLRVVVQRRRLRQRMRRPADPFARVLEGGRHHPEDREHDETRPPQQDDVPQHSRPALPAEPARPRLLGTHGCDRRRHPGLPSITRRCLISIEMPKKMKTENMMSSRTEAAAP